VSEFWTSKADATAWLLSLPEGSVDLVVTDPAYESLEKHRAHGTTTRLKKSSASSNEWFEIFHNHRFPDLFRAAYRAMRKNSHLYMMCDQETMFVVKPMAEAAGFKFWKPLVWDKQTIGMGYHYRNRYEVVLFFEKGKLRLNDLGIADVLPFSRVRNAYPTEKPVGLSEVLISQSTAAGAVVADPFMGSASTGEAALKLDRDFWGCDLSDKSLSLAQARLSVLPSATCRSVPPTSNAPQLGLGL